jgi:NAD(P)-dependent dehydrogenase (short-subunit alcohol dehydrogenase family)/uncharacterized OB-fold protein
MTRPIAPPPRKDPQKRTVSPTMPPSPRSRRALGFDVAAGEGRFTLQRCGACGAIMFPARDACRSCLSVALAWEDMPTGGQLIAETTIETSINTYFRERTPWRTGLVKLDCGITVVAHVHGDVEPEGRVRMIARIDKAGHGVMMALPEKETPHMADDKQLRELTCDPRHRRVLVTDARTRLGQAMVGALSRAGSSIVFAGVAEQWLPFEGGDDLARVPGCQVMPLDITDAISVRELAAEIGGKVDILINTAEYVRPGGAMDRDGVATAKDEMEINYFGLLRLVQAFGPAMRARGADGLNSACAWVNLRSVYALSNLPEFGSTSASHAAAHSLAQCLRAEFRGSGVKVLNVLFGPMDEDWRQPLPPPKVTPEALARAVVSGLQQGLEESVVGPVAEDIVRRWREDARALEYDLTQAVAR